MEKLTELQTKLSSNGLLKNGMQDLRLMRNLTQCRFLVGGKVGFMTITIGFAIEWQCSIITGFVLVKNASPEEFMTDNTSTPALPVAQEDNEADYGTDDTDIAVESSSSSSPVSIPEAPAPVPTAEAGAKKSVGHEGKAKGKGAGWYPGKYWHETKPFKTKKKLHAVKDSSQEGLMQGPVSSGVLGKLTDLQPPYLCPKPPRVQAMLSITVIGCNNLKSRLVRLRDRSVSAYVKVEVGSQTRCTAVVKRTGNPRFDPTETFLFTLTDSMRHHGGYIRFHIYDKNTLQDDILATRVVSLASLKCQMNSDDIPEITYPLVHNDRRAPLGKGLSRHIDESDTTLLVKIAKIDLEEWWVLEELRLRDLADEERRRLERDRARAARAEEVERMRLEQGVANTSNEWESDDNVVGCRRCAYICVCGVGYWVGCRVKCFSAFRCEMEFSLTIRKHHCRVCGRVVCGKCSQHRVVLKNGDTVRVRSFNG